MVRSSWPFFAMPIYSRCTFDDNSYQPFAAPVPIIARRWDVNITAFCVLTAILIAGIFSLAIG